MKELAVTTRTPDEWITFFENIKTKHSPKKCVISMLGYVIETEQGTMGERNVNGVMQQVPMSEERFKEAYSEGGAIIRAHKNALKIMLNE